MMSPTNERTMIVIPAQGMIDVRDAMTDILAEYGKEEISTLLACLWCVLVMYELRSTWHKIGLGLVWKKWHLRQQKETAQEQKWL